MKLLKKFTINQNQLVDVVQFLKNIRNEYPIITFSGPLGAGKTTLVKALLKLCGVEDVVTSPTFTIMNRYINKQNELFFHFDLYRLRVADDFIDGGFDEYLQLPNSLVCIEWPGVIDPILERVKSKVCSVSIDYDGLENRVIEIKIY